MIEMKTIESIFRNLDAYLLELRKLAENEKEELIGDSIKVGAAKYYLQVAIESCINVANHIIARQGFRAPKSYADAFTVLAERGVIAQDFLPTARKMARMRNRLVHLYWEVDDEIIYDTLQNYLNDFHRFKADIYKYLRTLEESGENRERM